MHPVLFETKFIFKDVHRHLLIESGSDLTATRAVYFGNTRPRRYSWKSVEVVDTAKKMKAPFFSNWKAETSRTGPRPPLDACLHGAPPCPPAAAPRVCRSQPVPRGPGCREVLGRGCRGRRRGAPHGDYLETGFLGPSGLGVPRDIEPWSP